MNAASSGKCWICRSEGLTLVKPSTLPSGRLAADAVRVTDSSYSVTADVFRCPQCGFLQCSDFTGVLELYESMSDPRYEETRSERAAQARQILSRLPREKIGGRLLDVGAGSGILVSEALKIGFDAAGIEPSRWLQAKAAELGLPVQLGILPSPMVKGPFDVLTVIDVIEHVADPVALMKECVALMKDNGCGILVTPDVDSVAARILGPRWWHYRPAHIGYFNRSTLIRALNTAGLEPIHFERARWVFPADYLWERVNSYLPSAVRLSAPSALKKLTVPLNLFDSWLVTFRKRPPATHVSLSGKLEKR